MLHTTKTKRLSLIILNFFIFVTASMVTLTAQAESYQPRPVPQYYHQKSPVQVDIVNDRNQAFRKIPTNSKAQNTQRAYIQATKGQRYSLRLRNTSNKRVGVVVTVDGRNILSGKKSWLRSNERMYILNPYETSIYKGWRTSKNKINRFFFTNAGNSYANAWGDNSAIGVVAVATFNEQPRQTYRYDNSLSSNKRARSAPSAKAEAGTGFGREEYSPTRSVHFKPVNQPAYKHFYKYEWRSSLCKRGVIVCQNRPKPKNRFWHEDNNYAPYPPGWHRNDNRGNN